MPKTRLISPGSIPNHKLLKNLQLQGNYISNDGGNEGISIDNDGMVTHSSHLIQAGRIYLYNEGGEYIQGDGEDMNLFANTDIKLDCGRAIVFDVDVDNALAGTRNLINIDLDKTGSVSSGNDIIAGIKLDLSTTGASNGIITSYGMNISVAGDSGGTSKVVGINLDVSGADTNQSLIAFGGNAGINTREPDRALEINDSGGNCLRLTYNDSSGSAANYADMAISSGGDLNITTIGDARYYLATDKDFVIYEGGTGTDNIRLKQSNAAANTILFLYAPDDADDYFKFEVGGSGSTTLTTVDNAAAIAHLSLIADGNISLDAEGHVKFDGCGVGFDQVTASFDATDTDINFKTGNKQKLTLTADITDVHFQFPDVSGNFVCLFIQDGTGGWDVSNWKTKDVAGNAGAGNSGVVKWAGDTATTLTEGANKVDIVSIYWDAATETAYAVASENF